MTDTSHAAQFETAELKALIVAPAPEALRVAMERGESKTDVVSRAISIYSILTTLGLGQAMEFQSVRGETIRIARVDRRDGLTVDHDPIP